MANVQHKDLTGADAVHQSAYVQGTDPGAVGPLKTWIDTSTDPATHKVRNATDDDWITVGVVEAGASTLDDLTDVDTTTTPPTDGQALVFDDVDDMWKPGTVGGGGGGSSGGPYVAATINYMEFGSSNFLPIVAPINTVTLGDSSLVDTINHRFVTPADGDYEFHFWALPSTMSSPPAGSEFRALLYRGADDPGGPGAEELLVMNIEYYGSDVSRFQAQGRAWVSLSQGDLIALAFRTGPDMYLYVVSDDFRLEVRAL